MNASCEQQSTFSWSLIGRYSTYEKMSSKKQPIVTISKWRNRQITNDYEVYDPSLNNLEKVTNRCGNVHDDGELGIQYTLYNKINTDNFECLNEYEENSGLTVFKTWKERLDTSLYVESDVDEELLFNIPFTGNVKLKGLIIIGGEDQTHPDIVRLYKNRPHMTFSDVTSEADQEFELYKDVHGVHEYPVRVVKFSSVSHLSLHFVGNGGAHRTKIYYIGLKGEWSPAHQHGVTICNYELLPQRGDHLKNMEDQSREVN